MLAGAVERDYIRLWAQRLGVIELLGELKAVAPVVRRLRTCAGFVRLLAATTPARLCYLSGGSESRRSSPYSGHEIGGSYPRVGRYSDDRNEAGP